MLCDKCQKNNATIYIKNIVNNQVRELHLCAECAENLGYHEPMENPFHAFGAFDPFTNLFAVTGKQENPATKQRCSVCNADITDIRRTGRAGCPHCYTLFETSMAPIIRKIHGASVHTGSIPKSAGAKISTKRILEEKKANLRNAVANEDYETAAKLRDEIRSLEASE